MQQQEQTESFGQAVRRRRSALGMSQDQLSDRTGGEVSKSYISQIENERKLQDGETVITPSIDLVDALADALGEPRNYFRRLTGHRLIEDESPIDLIAEEFAVALHRYRFLGDRSREFVKKMIRETVDFLFEAEHLRTTGPAVDETRQKLRYLDPKDIPTVSIDEARRLHGQPSKGKKK